MAVLFDTLKLADKLEAAGLTPEQAKGTATALAEGLTDTVATATDLEASELRLRAEIATVRTEIAAVRTEIAGLHSRLVWWIIGTGAVAALPIIGLLVPILIKLH